MSGFCTTTYVAAAERLVGGAPRRVVFLDFDGVLNSRASHDDAVPQHPALRLNREMVAWLNLLCRRTGAVVVLSTSWRTRIDATGCSVDCAGALAHLGFTGKVIGATPAFAAWPGVHTPRADEIRAWLAANPVDAFVTLDDHSDADVDGCGVRTDVRIGLTMADVEAATRILCR